MEMGDEELFSRKQVLGNPLLLEKIFCYLPLIDIKTSSLVSRCIYFLLSVHLLHFLRLCSLSVLETGMSVLCSPSSGQGRSWE